MKSYRKILALGTVMTVAVLPVASDAELRPPEIAEAPIAILVDLSSGQDLHSREEARRFLPASVTKVMTAFVAFELIDSGKLDPDRLIEVRADTAKEWSGKGSTMWVEPLQRITVDQLLHGITTVSANDGCVVLAEGVAGSIDAWSVLMNQKAAELGMADSYFGSPNGFPDEGRTFTSARDLAKLADALITRHPTLYRQYFGKHGFAFNGRVQNNHDPITGKFEGADGIKTGFTREAGYNFVGTAERDGRRLVMVVAGVSNAPLRADISKKYLEWGFDSFDNYPLFKAGQVIGGAEVQDGSIASLPLVAPRELHISVPKGQHPDLAMKIRYRGPIKAPVSKGQHIAELVVTGKGIDPFTIPLSAGEDVSKANMFQRIFNGIRGIIA